MPTKHTNRDSHSSASAPAKLPGPPKRDDDFDIVERYVRELRLPQIHLVNPGTSPDELKNK